jgi:hypothetical protein
MDTAVVGYITFMLLILLPISIFIVVFYAEPGFPWHTYITLVLGFYSAFGIMLMIPIDIATVIHDRDTTTTTQSTNYDYDVGTLNAIYNTFFTMVLILGSVVLSFEEYFNTDGKLLFSSCFTFFMFFLRVFSLFTGYFTLGGKLLSSFKRMMFDLAVPAVVGCIVLGILIGQKVVTSNADALKLTMIIITNTMYELGIVFLLGYALIEFPRQIWQRSDLDNALLRTQQKASQQFKDISETQLSVSLCVSDVLKTKQALASYADPDLNAAMDILVSG